jgi:PAS domain S-box-containing protein
MDHYHVLDSITDAVQVIDERWRLVYQNEASREIFRRQGVDPAATLGRHFWDEVFPDIRGQPVQRAYLHAMQSREVTEFETYYEPWQRWFWIRIFPLQQGGIATSAHDITERKHTQQLIQEQNRLLAAIAQGVPFADCLAAVTESLATLNPGTRACVLLADPRVERFEGCYSAQLPELAAVIRQLPIADLCKGPGGESLLQAAPIPCESIATDTSWAQSWRWSCLEQGVRACHAEVINGRNGEPVGWLVLCFSEARAINAWEREIAGFACSAASIAIEHERARIGGIKK